MRKSGSCNEKLNLVEVLLSSQEGKGGQGEGWPQTSPQWN